MSPELYQTLCSFIFLLPQTATIICGTLAMASALLWVSAPRWRGGRLPLTCGLSILTLNLALGTLLWILCNPALLSPPVTIIVPSLRILFPLLTFLLAHYWQKQNLKRSFLALGIYWLVSTLCHFLMDFSRYGAFPAYNQEPMNLTLTTYASTLLSPLLLAILLQLAFYRLAARPSTREILCYSAAYTLLSGQIHSLCGLLLSLGLSDLLLTGESALTLSLILPALLVALLSSLLLLLLNRWYFRLNWLRSSIPPLVFLLLFLLGVYCTFFILP